MPGFPTFPAPVRARNTDCQALQARPAEDEADLSALIAANMTRLYDHLTRSSITPARP